MTIENEAQFDQVLKRIDEIFDAVSGTPEGDELMILSKEAETYDRLYRSYPEPCLNGKIGIGSV